jgi:hypothetical protein
MNAAAPFDMTAHLVVDVEGVAIEHYTHDSIAGRAAATAKFVVSMKEDASAMSATQGVRPSKQRVPNNGLERAIAGALRAAINAHGPITTERIGSATKRVVGSLKNARLDGIAAALGRRGGLAGSKTIHRPPRPSAAVMKHPPSCAPSPDAASAWREAGRGDTCRSPSTISANRCPGTCRGSS